MRILIITLLLASLFLAVVQGCAKGTEPRQRFAAPPYHQASLQNFTVARIYMSEGRFELAREHLLYALAAAKDEEMRSRLNHELEAVEMMIATKR